MLRQRRSLRGSGAVVVLANREPYVHHRRPDGSIAVTRPAGGLVTGLEPVLRRCGGTWIASGTGSADRAHSDLHGRLRVPPGGHDYILRRLWFDPDVYDRYYSGFANQALWPLCHIAHTRPLFRAADWTAYRSVNEAFARAAIEEMDDDGLVLIQDYHFALVPRLIRSQAPSATTNLFWHIPWPNPDVFAICPWKEMLLEGITGADTIGFQTPRDCINFLESARRYLGCRIDLEEMSVAHRGHRSLVRAYPIGVEWPYPTASREEADALRHALGIAAGVHVSVGVDRADYTKGLLEKISAVELLLEQNPALAGNWTLVQVACPSRTAIPQYQQLARELTEAALRVNERFGNATYRPVILQMTALPPEEVRVYYRLADSAIVTPLHDGMNLVAKEYAASRDDGGGVLVLSVFAGAANELGGALAVNPYDTQQMADAILRAIRMPAAEQRARMRAIRERVAAHSVYTWSEEIIGDLQGVARRRRELIRRGTGTEWTPHEVVASG